MNIKRIMIIIVCIFTLTLCSTASAADTSHINSNNSSINSSHALTSANSTKIVPDPIISGVVKDNATNKGLANVTITVIQNNTQVAKTSTRSDGTYSLNFTNSNTAYTIIASKLGYMPYSKTITVTRSSDPNDTNFYGTANFRLYNLLKYSGDASSYVLNVGALPGILADIYAGKSSALVNSTSLNYSNGGGTPLEVKLLTASLLSGLLDVYSTGNDGYKIGGLLPSNNASLLSSLNLLGIDVGLLSATSNSSASVPQASGSSEVASLNVGIQLLLSLLSLNANLITANSSVAPNFTTGILVSSSNAGVASISLTLLGIPLLEIDALQSSATASVSGKAGGASAKFTWNVADIKSFGISILSDLKADGHVNIGLLGINILTLSLGSTENTATADGTYAKSSGDVLRLQILGFLGGGLINLVIGHAEAEAQVPAGGLHVNTSDLEINKTVSNKHPNYKDYVTFTLTAHNYGPDNATGVTVTDKLPTGLKFISATGTGTYNSTTGTWTIGNLANGANAVITIIAQVIASNTTITNIATVNETNYDPEPGNDQSNATITVDPASDLSITKTVDKKTANYLDKIHYTITITNNGPDTAANITVTDLLPTGLKFISSNGNYDSTTGIWTIDTLTNGATATLDIIAQIIKSNTTITNIATANNNTYDQNTTNNQDQTTTTVAAASDLEVTKTVNNKHPNYLQNVTFTITVHNNGPDTSTNTIVTDKLPTGLKFISSNGNYDSTTGTWTIGDLTNGSDAILNIIAQVITSNTTITNIANINGTNYDQNSTNNQDNATITINPASDLSITKTVNKTKPNYLDYVTFTLTVHNYGPDNATGVTVTDKLPTGLKYISSNGNYNSTTGIWTIDTITNGATATLDIIAQIISSNTQMTNIAEINEDNYDQNTTNDKSNATVTVGPASDLTITKTVDKKTANYLDKIHYTITITNNGPDNATNITVTDLLPTGLKFISSDGNYNSTTGIWTIGDLTNGSDAVLDIIAQIIKSNTTITNIVSVNGTNYDQNTTNNQDNTTTTVAAASDLTITKTVDKKHPNYLDYVTFTITVHNNGPDTSTSTIVTDKLPTGLKYISADGNYDSTTGLWTIGDLTNGSDAVLNIIAQVTASNTTITNIASVNGTNYDQNTTNNESNSTITINPASDLGITKTVNKTKPNYRDYITFTLTVHNYGPDNATGITVTDKLPTGLKFISATGTGTYDSATGTWTIGNLANGTNAVLNIIAQVIASNTTITNIASINEDNYDQNTTNDESNATVTVGPASDLSITKTVDKKTANYLDKIHYTITINNNGPDTAANITVTDLLPTGLKYISSNGNYDSTTGIWTIDTLTNGATTTLDIIAQIIKSNTTITNIATANNNTYDQNTTNNQDNTTTTVAAASDLEVTKTVNNKHPNYLQNVTFTITVHNNGPDTAANITVTDKLPTGLKYISSDGNYDSTTGIWTIDTLTNGSDAVLNIIAQVIASNTTITNIATVNGTNYDQNTTNNESNSTITVNAASDLSITKTVNNKHPNYKDYVTFTLTAHNYGPDNATGVTVTDKLPTGLKFISSDGNYDSTTGIWTIDTLTNGSDAVLNIIAQVTASNTTITNIADITGTNYDQNSTNNHANATITVSLASDLGITKTVDNSYPNYLQKVTFTLTAHNYGPDNATGVIVTDKLPNGLKFISATGTGSYDSTTGTWTIGNLTNGTSAVLKIIVQAITANAQVTNTANITGTNYDQNSTNDQSSAVVNIGPASDLGITITVNNTHPKYLDYVTFTLTAHNYGPNDAAYVKVYNTLPDKLKYVSDDSSGSFNSTTGLWTIGYMDNGATAVLHIVAQTMASNATLTDIARITDPDPEGTTSFYDPNQDNNQASVSLDVGPAADLSITKTVSNSNPNYLQKVTFTLTAHNYGPNNGTGVKIIDKLPSGLKFVSATGTGTYNSATGTWTIGNLANGANAVINIVAQIVTSNTQLINTANITGSEIDLNLTNNRANATVNIGPASDLGITKTVDNKNPKYLQKVTFTLTAHNYGPNNTTGVTVTDKLPSGLKFVSATGTGTYNSTTGTWTIGNLTNGANAVLKIIAQATSPNTQVTNTATINGTNYDQNSSNNKATAAVNIGPAADLAVGISVNNAHPKYLQKVTFTITAYNYGPMDAKNVTITIKMPAGFKYVSKDPNVKYNSKTGVWTIGNLKNGGKVVLHVVEQAVVSNVRLTCTAAIKGTAIIK